MNYKDELFTTPEVLRRVLREESAAELTEAEELVFCGCGTSWYMAGQVARILCAHGRKATDRDAVELTLENGPCPPGCVYVFLSRSGTSRETVMAMESVRARGGKTFYIGCTEDSPLGRGCDGRRVIPYGEEQLILESYSFYAQMLCALRCCALEAEETIPQTVEKALREGERCWREFISGKDIRRIICLGSPYFRPLQREMMLKAGEITQLPAEHWGILEFRHGPRSWADEHCLVLALSEEATALWDKRVGEELVSYGCHVVWYGAAPEGAWAVPAPGESAGAAETLALGAFLTAIFTEFGRSLGTKPENLRHVVHNVGVL